MRARLFVVTCFLIASCAVDPRPADDGVGGGSGSGSNTGGTGDDIHIPSILILDFRSGWWAGSAGEFHRTVLAPLRDDSNLTIEFHHFTVGNDVKCVYSPNGMQQCEMATMSATPTPDEVVARFDRHAWDDYLQVWILSGSEKDMSDIRVTGDLFGHFIAQAGQSCIPIFIGAGDGFIDHANALAQSLGIGQIMVTALANPGFFFGSSSVTVDSRMTAGAELGTHQIFENVEVVADGVANLVGQRAHGDALVPNPNVTVHARDSGGRSAIGYGEITLPNGDARPYIIDAGMQRYYAATVEPDTLELLLNIRRYLSSVGCRVIT